MRVIFTAHGEEDVEYMMLGLGERAEHPEPILRSIGRALREHEANLFDTGGRGEWPALAPSTIESKTENETSILIETEELRDALTGEGGDNLEHIVGDELIFGVIGEPGKKAAIHKAGYAPNNLPVRDPMIFDEQDQRKVVKAVQRYLIDTERSALGSTPFGVATLDPFGLQ